MKFFWSGLVMIAVLVGALFVVDMKYDIWNKIVSLNIKKSVDISKMTLDQQIKSFLNNESPYRAEDIQKDLIGRMQMPGDEYGDVTKNLKLGLVFSNTDPKISNVTKIEGVLLDYRKKDNSVLIVVGFDGKDGKRFITPLEIPTYVYEGVDKTKFNFVRLTNGTVDLGQKVESTDGSTDNVLKYLGELKDKPLALILDTLDYTKSMLNSGYTGVLGDFVKEYHRKVDYTRELVKEVDKNNLPDPAGIADMSTNVSINKIKSTSDINGINLSNVPMVSGIDML